MKRLYVRHQFPQQGRRQGTGGCRDRARQGGAATTVTCASTPLPWMHEAIALYRALGFRPIEPRPASAGDAVAMELPLV